jgi:ribose 5-phosphate isomerase RpiB
VRLPSESTTRVSSSGASGGVAVAARKPPGIRAAVGHDTDTAAQCVRPDDCNALAAGARVTGPMPAAACARPLHPIAPEHKEDFGD